MFLYVRCIKTTQTKPRRAWIFMELHWDTVPSVRLLRPQVDSWLIGLGVISDGLQSHDNYILHMLRASPALWTAITAQWQSLPLSKGDFLGLHQIGNHGNRCWLWWMGPMWEPCAPAYQTNRTSAPHWITRLLNGTESHVKSRRGAAGECCDVWDVNEAIVAGNMKKKALLDKLVCKCPGGNK